MRKRLLTVLTVLFAFVLGLSVLTACGGGMEISDTEITLAIGQPYTLTATDPNGEDITWTSSDDTVVTITTQVAKRGMAIVKALKSGKATLTAKNTSGASVSCEVTVEDIFVEITGEGVANGKLQMERFSTLKLSGVVKKDGQAQPGGVKWSSSSNEVVSVAEDGTLTANTEGKATITATQDGGAATGTIEVTVVWTAKPSDWYELEKWEQNKITPNIWGYWNDAGHETASITVSDAEYMGNTSTEKLSAGGVTLTYKNGNDANNEHGVQIFYRSSKGYNTANAGDGFTPYDESKLLLDVNATYLLKLDITVSASGTITVNGKQVDVVAGEKQSVVAPFTHTDTYIYPSGDYTNVGSAVFLMMGANGKMIQAATVTLENVRWEAWNGESTKLQTPSISLNGSTFTITDPNVAGVKDYTVGLFEKGAASDAEPVRAVVTSEKSATLDSSKWPNGDYELRVRANGLDVRYGNSDWSAGVNYTVSHGSVQYDLKEGGSDVAKSDLSDTYYYYVENAVVNEAKYSDGTITLDYEGSWSWTSMQLFYKNPNLTSGTKYTLTFKLNASVAGRIRINWTMVDLVAGDNDIEITYTEGSGADGLSLNIQFGEPNGDFSGTTSVLAEGTFTLKDIAWTKYEAPEGTIARGGQADAVANPGIWYLWADQGWTSSNVTVTKEELNMDAKTLILGYTTTGAPNLGYSVQLFFENGDNVTGSLYTLTMKVKLSVAGTITINDKQYTFTAGQEQDITIEYTEKGNGGEYNEGASIIVLMGVYQQTPVMDAEITISGWTWTQGAKLNVPTAFDIGADKKVTFTDTNEGASYELGFFKKADDAAPVVTLPITSGAAIDNTKLFAGSYIVKVRAVKEGSNASDWSQGKEYTVTKAAGEGTELQWGEEGKSVGTWVYWSDETVSVDHATFYEENGKYRISVKESSTGKVDWGFQLFHNDMENYENGKEYTLTLTANAKSDMSMTINGKVVSLTANTDTPVSQSFTLSYNGQPGGGSLLDIQVPQANGKTYEFELKDIAWEAAPEVEYQLGADILPSTTEMINSGKMDDPHVLDTFMYWYAQDESWGCGTAVTLSTHTYANNTITLAYQGGSVNYSVQLFYCNSHLDTTKEYLLSATITSTVDLSITVNGKPVTLKANKANEVKVAFTPATAALEDKAPWAVDIQMPGLNGEATVTIAGLKWNEILGTGSGSGTGGQPSTPTEGTAMTKLDSKDGVGLVKGKWSYYAASNVTVKTANVSADGKTVTVTVSGLAKVGDFSIFFTPEGYEDGSKHTIVADYLVSSTTDQGACTFTLKNSAAPTVGYTYGQAFTGQGIDFTTTGGVFYCLTIGFLNGAGVEEVPKGEVTLTISNINLPN